LICRVKEIESELTKMGAVYDCGEYKPDPNKFVDKSCFTEYLAGAKRSRETGQSLDRNVFGMLKCGRPIDTAVFKAVVKKLYDEECDCYIALRQFQLDGVKFDF
jgi:hypothetical protein